MKVIKDMDKKQQREFTESIIGKLLDEFKSLAGFNVTSSTPTVDTLRHYSDRSNLGLSRYLAANGTIIDIKSLVSDIDFKFNIICYPCIEDDFFLIKVYDPYSFAFVGPGNKLERVSKEPIVRQTYRFKSDGVDRIVKDVVRDHDITLGQILKTSI